MGINARSLLRWAYSVAIGFTTLVQNGSSVTSLQGKRGSASKATVMGISAAVALPCALVDLLDAYALQGGHIAKGGKLAGRTDGYEAISEEGVSHLGKARALQVINLTSSLVNTFGDRYFLLSSLLDLLNGMEFKALDFLKDYDDGPCFLSVCAVLSLIAYLNRTCVDSYSSNALILKIIGKEPSKLPIQQPLVKLLGSNPLFRYVYQWVANAESALFDDTMACLLLPSVFWQLFNLELPPFLQAALTFGLGGFLAVVSLPPSVIRARRFDALAFNKHVAQCTGIPIPPESLRLSPNQRKATYGLLTASSVFAGLNFGVPAILALSGLVDYLDNDSTPDALRYSLYMILMSVIIGVTFLGNQYSEVDASMRSLEIDSDASSTSEFSDSTAAYQP